MKPHFSVWYISPSVSWHQTTFFHSPPHTKLSSTTFGVEKRVWQPRDGDVLGTFDHHQEAKGSGVQVVANEERKGPRDQVIPDLGDQGGDF